MPHRKNIVGDLGTTKIASDSYDIDNIYFTQEGWVYRHYKRSDKSKFWDEIIVAGEVDVNDAANGAIEETVTTDPREHLGLHGHKSTEFPVYDPPEFEGITASGDLIVDYLYSPLYDENNTPDGGPSDAARDTLEGGGVPEFDTTGDGSGDFDPGAYQGITGAPM